MANNPSAIKRAHQAEKRRAANGSKRSRLRTAVRKMVRAVEAKDPQAARAALSTAVPVLDSMVNKGIIHKNKAARHKSRLNKALRALISSAT
ncbi:MAG: 30S ribosomal protein S20 [Gammaproteobacteria bacterium]